MAAEREHAGEMQVLRSRAAFSGRAVGEMPQPGLDAPGILALQQTAGNAAVGSLVRSGLLQRWFTRNVPYAKRAYNRGKEHAGGNHEDITLGVLNEPGRSGRFGSRASALLGYRSAAPDDLKPRMHDLTKSYFPELQKSASAPIRTRS